MHACLYNTTYDPQVEGLKTRFIIELIYLTKTPDFYRQHILTAARAIDSDTDDRDVAHLIELASQFAQRGDTTAREIVYEQFLRNPADEDTLGANAIVEIDGLEGFLYVVGNIIKHNYGADAHYVWGTLLYTLEDVIGEHRCRKELPQLRRTNPDLDTYLRLNRERKERYATHAKKRQMSNPITYADLRLRIQENTSFNPHQWAAQATESDLNRAAADLLQQDDVNTLRHYLRLFIKRPYPLPPESLFRLVDAYAPDSRIPGMVLSVLSNIRHEAVREFGLRLIAESRFQGRAVRLLTYNFKQEDWAMIFGLTEQKFDNDTYHSFGWSVQDIFKQHPESEAVPSLLNIYNYGPCSTCRERILRMLASLNAIPDNIGQECLYDSNEDIRELASNNFRFLET